MRCYVNSERVLMTRIMSKTRLHSCQSKKRTLEFHKHAVLQLPGLTLSLTIFATWQLRHHENKEATEHSEKWFGAKKKSMHSRHDVPKAKKVTWERWMTMCRSVKEEEGLSAPRLGHPPFENGSLRQRPKSLMWPIGLVAVRLRWRDLGRSSRRPSRPMNKEDLEHDDKKGVRWSLTRSNTSWHILLGVAMMTNSQALGDYGWQRGKCIMMDVIKETRVETTRSKNIASTSSIGASTHSYSSEITNDNHFPSFILELVASSW